MFFNCWIFRERDICVLKGVLWGPGGQVEVYDYAKGQFCWTFWAHLFQISSDVFLFCFCWCSVKTRVWTMKALLAKYENTYKKLDSRVIT